MYNRDRLSCEGYLIYLESNYSKDLVYIAIGSSYPTLRLYLSHTTLTIL